MPCKFARVRGTREPLYLRSMAMLTLSAQLADTGDEVSRPISTMLQAVPEFASMMGQTAFSVGAALLAWLLLRSGRVPRWLAIWGLIAVPMMLVAGLPLPFISDPNSAAATLLCAPMAVQEMVFAVWLIGWGFRPPTTSMPIIEQRSARTPATTSRSSAPPAAPAAACSPSCSTVRWQCGRSCAPPPARVAGNPLVDAVEAGLLALPVERLAQDLADCGTVTSGLGHPIGAKGVFGPPRDLVAAAIRAGRGRHPLLQPNRGQQPRADMSQ